MIFCGIGHSVVEKEKTIFSPLGPCIMVILRCEITGLVGAGHCMLPRPIYTDEFRSSFEEVIPVLLSKMKKAGSSSKLKAKLVGGCRHQSNIDKAEDMMEDLGIEVVWRDLGGEQNRSVKVNPATFEVSVEKLQPWIF